MVPGLGGFCPGYVLIAPLDHELNLRSAATKEDGFVSFVDGALKFLADRLGRLTFWEHGAPTGSTKQRSACIDHAHLHVVPGQLNLPKPSQGQPFTRLSDALTKKTNLEEADGYLLLGWSDGQVIVGADVMMSQYYRREWAKLVGRHSEWDYLVAEDTRITEATIRLLLPIDGG
jgi:hypothetical protein